MKRPFVCTIAGLAIMALAGATRADVVTDWNRNMSKTVLATKTSPLVTHGSRPSSTTAVFDAVNGIERRYTPIHVDPDAPPGARGAPPPSRRLMRRSSPSSRHRRTGLDAQRQASLAGITDDGDFEDSKSIERGIAWGQTVADAILAWRSTDGFTPPPPAVPRWRPVGEWRPTPPGFLPGPAPQFATMTPWVLAAPAVPPAGPADLASDQYAADFNEVKAIGSLTGSTRTDFQTEVANFWNGNTALYWNRIALTMAAQSDTTLSENARLFALLNIAMADAAIACWDAKYTTSSGGRSPPSGWRTPTATRPPIADPTWTPLLITPNFPEYPSGHSDGQPGRGGGPPGRSSATAAPSRSIRTCCPASLHSFTSFAAAADEAFVAPDLRRHPLPYVLPGRT